MKKTNGKKGRKKKDSNIKEKGLLSEKLYTIQESEKPYCTAKELI